MINYLLFTFYIFLDFIGLSFIQGAPKKAWILLVGKSSKLIPFQGLFQRQLYHQQI